jgi:hypothetical protein
MCYFFAVPLGFLMPISEAGINLSWLNSLSNILIAIGVIGFGAGVVIKTLEYMGDLYLKHKSRGRIFDFADFTYYSLQDYAFWLNSICFVLAFFFMSYFFWH